MLLAQTSLELTGRYWIPQMSTRVRVEANGFGTDIDARRDLGMDDANFPAGAVEFRHGRTRLRFDYTPIDYSGDQTVTRTVLFGGREYTVGTRVVSDLEVRHLQLSWSYQLVNIREGLFRLGPLMEIDGFLLRGSLAAPSLSVDRTEDLKVGLPAIGALMTIQPHRAVEIYAQMAGLKVGDYGSYVGSDSGVKVRPWKHVVLTGGYRTFNLNARVSPDFAHVRLGGPFVGAGLRF
jgi:hypothetical protein